MPKIGPLKKWKNNEVLTSSDYVFERDTIAGTVNTIIDEQTAQDNLLTGLRTDVDDNIENIESNDTDITALQTGKFDKTGGTITGNLAVTGTTNLQGLATIPTASITNLTVAGTNITNTVNAVNGLLDGSVIANRAKNTDDGAGNANTAQAIAQTVGHINQNVKDNSTPTFVGVTLGDKTLTETKLNDLDTAKQHADITAGNPHQLDKSDIGLPNVDNTSDANKPISEATASALEGKVDLENGFVKASQLPSYVDDIVEFNTLALLEDATKEVAKIYVVTSDPTPANNTSYRLTASGTLVKFDHTSAEWGHVTGNIINQIDIENALFTSTVNEGLVSGTTVKTAINDLDAALKITNQNVGTNAGAISTNASAVSTNASAISSNATNIANIANGMTDITFAPGASGLTSNKVEEAIIEVKGNVVTVDGKVNDVVDGTTNILFDVRATNLVSANIENAIHEIYGQKAQPLGIATLDGDGRIPTSQLTINAIEFKGTFGSSSSTTEGDLPTTQVTRGDMYVCDEDNYVSTVSGITFNNTDKAIYDGTNWVKNDAQDAVISVNTKTGSITLAAGDIGVNASGFDGELSTSDDTIQKALQTLDDHSHDFSEITNKPTSVSGFGITDAYTKTETNGFLNNKVDVGSIGANDVSYDNTNSSLQAVNLQTAVDELDNVLQSNITAIRVEQFEIISVDAGNNSFVYQDADLQNQTGTIDGNGFYIFDLQISGYYTNNYLAEVNINDDIHYYTSDGDKFREGDGDSEGVATSVKVNYAFAPGDEIDVRYYQGLNIAASAVGDGAVSFGKLDATLQSDIQEVRDASSTNAVDTIVKRNASNEFQGILDGKFKTARTIALAGDVTGQAQFDGSSGITIQTVVAKQNFDGGSATSVFSPEDIIIEGGGA